VKSIDFDAGMFFQPKITLLLSVNFIRSKDGPIAHDIDRNSDRGTDCISAS